MSAPFMQLYVADYLGDTQHLTAEQHGAYLLLLMTMWRQGGSLPSDPNKLARIARVSPRRWHLISADLMSFFDERDGFITQKRLVEEYQKAVSKSEKRSASGKLGGEAKSLKNNGLAVANAKQMPKHLSEPESEEEEAKASPSSARDDEQAAFDAWNETARRVGLPIAEKLTRERRAKLRARLAEVDGLPGWRRSLERVEASDLCAGRRSGFRADLDFLLQLRSFTRLNEGSYDNNPNRKVSHGQRHANSGKPSTRDQIREGIRRANAGGCVRGPIEEGGQRGGAERPGDEPSRGMATRTISLKRGENGAYEDPQQHRHRHADTRQRG